MKLEVGMYCYNKTNRKLGIGKIISFPIKNNVNIRYKNDIETTSIENVEASHNILDLIEPMDLLYIDISPDNCGGIVVPRIPETYCELEQIKDNIKLGKYILIGVITKELLNENIFEVGGSNE